MDINTDQIRDEMTNRNQWLCWEIAMRDGKETKLPKDPETGGFAQTDDPSTWGSFINALSKANSGEMDGVGFVFTEDDNYVGIDLDDCRDPETEEWDDWALEIMEDIGGWIEISPSGTGAHIILKGEIPGSRNRKGDLEMYEDGRFFTITGQLVDVNGERLDDGAKTPEIKEAQLALDAVYDRFLAEDDESANDTTVDVDPDKWGHVDLEDHGDSNTNTSVRGPSIDDLPSELRDIFNAAKTANNGYAFTELWRGNWKSNADYPSQSEADLAFCDMLAFWFSGDPERMDRVFRASGLMRPKWDDVRYSDGSTYGERTIEKAIAEVDDHYDDDYYDELIDDTGTHDNLDNAPSVDKAGSAGDENSDQSGNSGTQSTPPQGEQGGSTNTQDSTSETGSAEESSSFDNVSEARDQDQQPNQEREQNTGRTSGRSRGRDAGQKRSREVRDSIPDTENLHTESGTEAQSANSTTEASAADSQDSSASPGPDGGSGEDHYTELNSEFQGGDGSTPSYDDSDGGMMSGGDSDGSEEDGHDLPSKDEASDMYDGMEEEEEDENTSSTPPEPRDNNADGDKLEDDTSSSTAQETTSDWGRDADEDDSASDEATGESTDSTGASGKSVEELEERIELLEDEISDLKDDLRTKTEEIEANVQRNEDELNTAKAQLQHDIELEDDKLERIYRELQQYEDLVDKRENQLQTIYQLLVLLSHVQPEPLFDRVENILLSMDNIPKENIFSDSVGDIVDDYDSKPDSSESPDLFDPVDGNADGRNPQPSPPDQTSRPGETDDSTIGRTDDDAPKEEDDETSFLSRYF